MAKYGNIGVNSEPQSKNFSLASQKEELLKKCVSNENIYQEICSVNELEGPELRRLLELVQRGDTIMVIRMDRFARSNFSALNLI